MKTRVIALMAILGAAATVVFSVSAATADIVPLKITQHSAECHIVSTGDAVACSGKYSGLGNSVTEVTVTAPFTCTNKAGNVVQGQSGGSSGPITPQNGQITFTNVTTTTSSTKCTHADGHQICFGPTATIQIFQDGVEVVNDQVAISNFNPACQP
jgi:hypothetical protein